MSVFYLNYKKSRSQDSMPENVLSFSTQNSPIDKYRIIVDDSKTVKVEPTVNKIQDYNFSTIINLLKSYKIFIYFESDNCSECNEFITSVNNKDDFYNDVIIFKANIDKDRSLLTKYKVNSVNTIIQLNEQNEVINKYRNPTLSTFADNIK